MNRSLKAVAVGVHVFLVLFCLPSNYLGMAVNAGFAAFWLLMFLAGLSRNHSHHGYTAKGGIDET